MKNNIEAYFKIIKNNLFDNFQGFLDSIDFFCKDISNYSIDNIYQKLSIKSQKLVKKDINQLTSIDNFNKTKNRIELIIMPKNEFYDECFDKFLTIILKKKYNCDFLIKNDNQFIRIFLNNPDNFIDIVDLLNIKYGKYLSNAIPFLFNMDKVMISIEMDCDYVYYLFEYLKIFIANNKSYNYEIYKNSILTNFYNVENRINLYNYLKYNNQNMKLSTLFSELNIFFSMSIKTFNGDDYQEFLKYYSKINKKNNYLIKKYSLYDNLNEAEKVFKNSFEVMLENDNIVNLKERLLKYRDTGNIDYLSRKNDIRKNFSSCKTMMIYLYTIDLSEKINDLFYNYVVNKKIKVLEDVCKENYLFRKETDDSLAGKIQVARGLIRMETGDYLGITRNNNARMIAENNIKPDEVVKLIKKALNNIDDDESRLYEIYANYIESLCV